MNKSDRLMMSEDRVRKVKTVAISPLAHEKLVELANMNHRDIGAQVEFMADQALEYQRKHPTMHVISVATMSMLVVDD